MMEVEEVVEEVGEEAVAMMEEVEEVGRWR